MADLVHRSEAPEGTTKSASSDWSLPEILYVSGFFFLFFLLFLSVGLLFISGIPPIRLQNRVEEGKLYIFSDDRQYWGGVSDFCVKGDFLYVLFESKGVLKIYDKDGQYIKTCAFKMDKGRAELYADKDFVYLYDQNRNYYTFSAGEMTAYSSYADYSTYRRQLSSYDSREEQRKTDDVTYYMKLGSIYRANEDGTTEEIVHRPLSLAYFQGAVPYISGFIVFAMMFAYPIIVSLFFKHNKGDRSQVLHRTGE